MYRFIGRHAPELIAVLASSFVILAGSYLAWFHNPAWLNRAGSLVIIVGVLLAASRFHEWVQQKLAAFLKTNYDAVADEVLRTVAEETTPLSDEYRRKVKALMKTGIRKDFARIVETDRRRIRAWEVLLVVVGTFLNGFGDYLISVLKNHGT